MATNLMRRRETREPTTSMSRPEPFRSLRDWEPFSLLRDMLRWDPFGDMEPLAGPEMAFLPRINLRERADGYHISMDLPGIREEDVEISVTGNHLTVSGQVQEEQRDESDRYYAFERSCGRFSRSFTLPEGADLDNIKAELRDGVLHINVPKKAGVQAKRIPVEASKGGEAQGAERQVKVDKTDKPEKAAA